MQTSHIECHFCGCTVPTIEIAIARHWVPSFWVAGDEWETVDPVCPHCVAENIEVAEDGELVQVTD